MALRPYNDNDWKDWYLTSQNKDRHMHEYYAKKCGYTEAEAAVEWGNTHRIGKYVICESREGYKGRMFIRLLLTPLTDGMHKDGWWNTFTLSTKEMPFGKFYLCKIKEYRTDKNGFLNLIVDPITEFPELKMSGLFEPTAGTWKSSGIMYMIGANNNFLEDFRNAVYISVTDFNIKELNKRFPEYLDKNDLLEAWLSGKVELTDIDAALDEPTDEEKFIASLRSAIIKGNVDAIIPEQFPLLKANILKEKESILSGYGAFSSAVSDYFCRKKYRYQQLVESNLINPVEDIEGDTFDWDSGYCTDEAGLLTAYTRIEEVLKYDVKRKEEEKAARKAKRKAAKSIKKEA